MKKTHIVKRNGKKDKFSQEKIEVVIESVLSENNNDGELSPLVVEKTLDLIENTQTKVISTEEINDHVQRAFMECGFFEEAKNFILHREKNKNIRAISADNEAMSNYIFMNRYSRYIPKKKRRETWNESVNRVRDMNLRKYPMAEEDIMWAFEQVRQKRVLPSMRSMQFGGEPIEKNNIRMYNCSYGAVDRKEFFQEAMYLLLCGAGVGLSVCFEDVAKLPPIKSPCMKTIKQVKIDDSIEGWADSIKEIMNSYFHGYTIEFDYSLIRKQGSKISSGGLAPGHVPLRRAIEKIRTILDKAVGRRLKPIEAYDVVMHEADAVLAGGR